MNNSDRSEVSILQSRVPNACREITYPDKKGFWVPLIEKWHSSLLGNKTLQHAGRTPNTHVLPFRKFLGVKKDINPKVCIGAKGLFQFPCVNYHETYVPLVWLTTFAFSYASSITLKSIVIRWMWSKHFLILI